MSGNRSIRGTYSSAEQNSVDPSPTPKVGFELGSSGLMPCEMNDDFMGCLILKQVGRIKFVG